MSDANSIPDPEWEWEWNYNYDGIEVEWVIPFDEHLLSYRRIHSTFCEDVFCGTCFYRFLLIYIAQDGAGRLVEADILPTNWLIA